MNENINLGAEELAKYSKGQETGDVCTYSESNRSVCFLSSFQELPGDAQVRSECCLISANAEGSSVTFRWSLAVHAHSIFLLIQLHTLDIVWANHASLVYVRQHDGQYSQNGLICHLGGSTCKVEDVIKIGNKANEQSKVQCKEKHKRLCHFIRWFWLILESNRVTASGHSTPYGSLPRQRNKQC